MHENFKTSDKADLTHPTSKRSLYLKKIQGRKIREDETKILSLSLNTFFFSFSVLSRFSLAAQQNKIHFGQEIITHLMWSV